MLSRKLLVVLGALLSLLLSTAAWAAPIIAPTSTWTPAQTGRTWMDIGGVWNGTADVSNTTGDTVTFVLDNTALVTAANHAYDIYTRAYLPAGFVYVPNTVAVNTTGTGCATPAPTITATQNGNFLNFSISPLGYDLYAQCRMTISYGIKVDNTGVSGTAQLVNQWTYALTQGGALLQDPYGTAPDFLYGNPLNILVQAGASVISKLPANQLKRVNATANWTVEVKNTGLGGLFDVSVDEYTINPSASLSMTSMVATAPAAPSATVVSTPAPAKRQVTYLAPGGIFKNTVAATVTSCRNINNTVYTTDRTGKTAKSGSAQVTLDKVLPVIGLTVNNYTLAYNAVTPMQVTVQNTGLGDAGNFALQSTLNTQGITVSNVAAGWTYNAATGLFTYTAGTVAAGATVVLTFDVAASNVCTFSGSVNIGWTAQYQDPCGDVYHVPTVTNTLTLPSASLPSLSLTNDSVAAGTTTPVVDRFAVNTPARFVVGFSAANANLVNGTSFVVQDVLPVGITGITLTPPAGTTASCVNAPCLAGDTVTWTIPKASLPLAGGLLIDYTTPANTCLAGTSINNQASTSATSVKGCAISTTANAAPLLTNNLPAVLANQTFNVGTPIAGAYFETGSPTASTVPTRAASGDGEFIPFTANYTFGAGTGTWAGSTYKDDFAQSGASLVPNTLTYQVNGGAITPVPAARVTCGTGSVATNNCSGNMTIDLGFITVNGGNVANQSLSFSYKTTVPDSALGAAASKNLTQLATLTLAGGTGGCNTAGTTQTYTLGAFVPVARAQAKIALSMPATIDVCEPAVATMTLSNGTEEFPSRVQASVATGGSYAFPTPQTPVYGGLFNTGNMIYTPNGGINPTFALTPKMTAAGTIQFVLQLKRNSTTAPQAAQVRVDYDDYQTDPTPVRDFYSTAQATPTLVRKGQLAISMTPQRYTVINSTASWKIFVTNVGDGTAFGATLSNVLPAGMTLDAVATNAANTGQCSPLATCNATLTGQTVSWALGDIAPGSTRIMTLNALMTGAVCSIPDGSNQVTAKWGCGGVTLGPPTVAEPNFLFPAGQMQVVHDTTGTFAPMCGTGKDVIIVRNTGVPDILDVYAQEVLNTATTGLALVPGTVQYSTDGGVSWLAGADPTGLGTTASPFTWSSAQIPPLADLYSATSGNVSEVRIRFDITVGEKANVTPSITASGHGVISCGNPVSSPGAAFTVPVRKPHITVTKQGINRTVTPTGGTYGNLVFGGVGDTVEWKVTVQNAGTVNDTYTAYNLRLSDTFAGSGATAMSVLQKPVNALSLGATIANGTVYSLPDLPLNATQTYLFRETLGNVCTNWGSENVVNVSWGCINNGAAVHSNLTSTSSTAKAGLVMQPGFNDFANSTQIVKSDLPPAGATTWVHKFPGVVEVQVPFANGGAAAKHIQLSTLGLPANMMLDPYAAMTVTGTAVNTAAGACVTNLCLDGTATNVGTATVPVFQLGGLGMRHNTNATLTYYLVPKLLDTQFSQTYPDLAAMEANAVNGVLDPLPSSYGGTYTMNLDSYSTCATFPSVGNTATVDPLIPDLDMTVSPAVAVVRDNYTMNFDFTFQNTGEAGSIVQFIDFSLPQVGGGLTINSVTVTQAGLSPGTWLTCSQTVAGNPNSWTCPNPIFGYYIGTGAASSMTVRVNVTTHDNGQPLTLVGEVTGRSKSQDGNTLLGNFSHDRAAPRILGLNFKKTLVKTTEAFTTDPYVAIGEDVTYDLYARLFGGDAALAPAGGGVFQNVILRDTLPSGMGLVSLAPQANNTLPAVVSGTATPAGSNPLKAGVVNMSVTPYANATALTFDYYATARVLNTAGNVDGTSLLNSFGGSLSYQGQVIHSGSLLDGFSGGVSDSALHAEYTVSVQRPTVTIVKTVRNVTAGGTFAPQANGNAADVYEYRVVLKNTGTAPAYDLKVTDALPNTLLLKDGAADGIDNDGDGLVDAADTGGEGLFTVVAAPAGGGSIVFDDVYTAIATAGRNFAKLNPGATMTLLYQVTGNPARVTGGITVKNTATVSYTTLPGASGSMTAGVVRASGAVDGEGSGSAAGSAFVSMAGSSSASVFQGRVFEDNGVGVGGIAHNAIQDGSEKGIAKVKVELTDCSTNVYATVYTDGQGDFSLPLDKNLNLANGSTLCIKETNPTAYMSTGGKVGTLGVGATYTATQDEMRFTLNTAGSPFTGISFADIAPNIFLTDNVGLALPGTTKFYPHVFTASTSGTVKFSSSFTASVNNPAWHNVLYQDSNCNQVLDAGEPQLAPTTVVNMVADQYACILDKQFIPSNIAYDSRVVASIQASFTYAPVAGVANGNLPVTTYTRTDTTIVGQEGLTLHKAVDKPTAKPGDTITYTITYSNPTQGVLSNLVIHDATPAYTTFVSAACGTPLATGLTACTATGPTVGTSGAIQWSMTGSLQPGGSGAVSYQVRVAP